MPRLEYLNFDIAVEHSGVGYRARVTSPAGKAVVEFPPFSEAESGVLLEQFGHRSRVRLGSNNPAQLIMQFGTQLFDAVFHGDVLINFRLSRSLAARASKGLRVQLRLAEAPALASLPWEFLYDTARQKFLALSKETPIVRFVESAQERPPLTAAAPLRWLAVLASPNDYVALDIDQEWEHLKEVFKSLRGKRKLTLTRVEPPTIDALRAYLRRETYHGLHFFGHGEFDEDLQEGVLVFQDRDGEGNTYNAERIAGVLQDAGALRLVVLDASESGRAAERDPLAGIAPRLARQGIPVVVAMQFPMTDFAADKFSTEMYSALADGYPVEAAVSDARQALYSGAGVLEWGTPVLFTCTEESVTLETEEEMEEKSSQGKSRGGINISGDAHISFGGDMVSGDKVVQGDDYHAAGDINRIDIGANAQVGQVAAGNNIAQTNIVNPAEKNDLAAKLGEVNTTLQALAAKLDATKLELAKYQLEQLQDELTGTDGAPNSKIIMRAADGLLTNVPALGGPLGVVFRSAAAQKMLARAGAVDWAQERFGTM